MTNVYTIPFLIDYVKGTTLSDWNAVTTASRVNFASVISPIGGASSIKVKTLNTLLGGNLKAVVHGTGTFASFGITPRARLLKALRLRSTGVTF